jgi:hypothetical protein
VFTRKCPNSPIGSKRRSSFDVIRQHITNCIVCLRERLLNASFIMNNLNDTVINFNWTKYFFYDDVYRLCVNTACKRLSRSSNLKWGNSEIHMITIVRSLNLYLR